jgi:hypothetical protein
MKSMVQKANNTPKINLIFRFRWDKAGTLAWELKNLSLDETSIKMFVMKFLVEFLQQYPLDEPESFLAWKSYLKCKQEEFKLLWRQLETKDEPFYVFAERRRNFLKKARIFFTKTDVNDNMPMVKLSEIMQKNWRGWYGEEDILTQVAFFDLQDALMEGNIFICLNCRKLFIRPQRGPKPSFCTRSCQNQFYYKKRR